MKIAPMIRKSTILSGMIPPMFIHPILLYHFGKFFREFSPRTISTIPLNNMDVEIVVITAGISRKATQNPLNAPQSIQTMIPTITQMSDGSPLSIRSPVTIPPRIICAATDTSMSPSRRMNTIPSTSGETSRPALIID